MPPSHIGAGFVSGVPVCVNPKCLATFSDHVSNGACKGHPKGGAIFHKTPTGAALRLNASEWKVGKAEGLSLVAGWEGSTYPSFSLLAGGFIEGMIIPIGDPGFCLRNWRIER